jgi:plastocyanin
VPTISSFTASQTTVAPGTTVTLNWTVSGDSYDYIDVVGPVRNGSQTVAPSKTTTYTLNSTNAYGRSTKEVTVTVN